MVKIRLVGSLVSCVKASEFEVEIPRPITIVDLISEMRRDDKGQKLTKMILDPELDDPRPNTIIMINDREIGTLEGLESEVHDGDVVTFVPVAHGG